jgi:hypothetical protein
VTRLGLCLMCGLVGGCGNSLPGPGNCNPGTSGAIADVTSIQLIGASVAFDDLRYAPDLGRVVAAPEATGKLFLIDPDSLAVTMIDVPFGVGSADGVAGFVFAADRTNSQIDVIDVGMARVVSNVQLDSGPDYVRASPTTDEVWVTLPSAGRIDVLSHAGSQLSVVGSVTGIGDPEGLTFDGSGRAYTNDRGKVVAIDVATRSVVGSWTDGCGSSHGFPQVDVGRAYAIGGCGSSGGVGVVGFDGSMRSGFEAGGDAAILAYDATLHHLYVRGDPGDTLDVLGACTDGSLALLGSVAIPDRGHGATVDDQGHAWICDALHGGVLRVTDPYPATM